jgi:hypothetical protein
MKSEQNNVTLNMDIEDDYYISGSLAMNMLTFYIDVVYCFFLLFLSIYYIFAPYLRRSLRLNIY